MLLGPAVRLGRAPVQAHHEAQVLVRFLLVRQRPVVVVGLLPVRGAGGARQVDEGGQEEEGLEETKEAECGSGRPHACVEPSGASELHRPG